MLQRPSDRWISIALSVLLHGALLAALVYGWWMFREQRRAAPAPVIQAAVVDARTLKGLEQPPTPKPAAAPPPPEDVGPPPPTPEERAQREQAEQARQRAEEQKAAQEH